MPDFAKRLRQKWEVIEKAERDKRDKSQPMLKKLKADNPYKYRGKNSRDASAILWQSGVEHCYNRLREEGYRQIPSEEALEGWFENEGIRIFSVEVTALRQWLMEQE